VGSSGNEARLRALIASADAKRQELDRLQKQLEDNKTVVNIQRVPIEAQIVSRARPSGTPFWPRKGPFTLLAASAAFLIGFAVRLVRALPAGGAPERASRAAPDGVRRTDPPELSPARGRQPKAPPGHVPQQASIDAVVARLLNRTDVASGLRTLITGAETG